MPILIFAAILGALLGMTLRPPLLAVAVSLAGAGGLESGLALLSRIARARPGEQLLADRLDLLIGGDSHALWAVLAAAGVGSIASAVMWSVANRQSTDNYWFMRGRRERRLRLSDTVEDRPIQTEAESRFRDILGR